MFFPKKKFFLSCLKKIFKKKKVEITIRLVDLIEIQLLNKKYRNKNIPTNVLSFPATSNIYIKHKFRNYIGDIILCAHYINKESLLLRKNILEHWAHMIIHSTLHLLHYTHNTAQSAKKMQTVENIIMKKLGFLNPYNLY
ncbi:rRNA maturation RNase YbeY [Buchnera aphidicola]|uniref:rRNA maturation RNase YbeY n=1 Tax=Buchnera aphidicola TaxID=9 RepID=UPI0012AC531F|nr:rRNA maturation RNase YbeY [Buchnera aphidicola]